MFPDANDINIANIPNVVATCVALHNYCEMHGDECQPEWVHTEVNATQQSAPTHGNTSKITLLLKNSKCPQNLPIQ